EAVWEEKVAAAGRGRGGNASRGAGSRRCGAGWREREEAEGAASGLPRGRQRERVPRRVSAVGGGRRAETGRIRRDSGAMSASGSERSTNMKADVEPLTRRPAWKAL